MKIDGEVKAGLGKGAFFISQEFYSNEGFGAVKYIEAVLNDEVKGAIVFPAKTVHDMNYLEFIAEVRLRDELGLEDGDIVTLEF